MTQSVSGRDFSGRRALFGRNRLSNSISLSIISLRASLRLVDVYLLLSVKFQSINQLLCVCKVLVCKRICVCVSRTSQSEEYKLYDFSLFSLCLPPILSLFRSLSLYERRSVSHKLTSINQRTLRVGINIKHRVPFKA